MYKTTDSPRKSPSGMTFQRKMLPRTSGGRRVDTFNNEFRARLSRIMALSCSWICFSNASMELRLISRSIAVRETRQELRNDLEGSSTHVDSNISSQSAEEGNSSVVDVDEGNRAGSSDGARRLRTWGPALPRLASVGIFPHILISRPTCATMSTLSATHHGMPLSCVCRPLPRGYFRDQFSTNRVLRKSGSSWRMSPPGEGPSDPRCLSYNTS